MSPPWLIPQTPHFSPKLNSFWKANGRLWLKKCVALITSLDVLRAVLGATLDYMKREESFPSASASTEQWLLSVWQLVYLLGAWVSTAHLGWPPHSDLWETGAEMSHGGRTDKATAYQLELAELDWASAQRAESTIKNKLIYASIFPPRGSLILLSQ